LQVNGSAKSMLFGNASGYVVKTYNNTLDDGSGTATLIGGVQLPGLNSVYWTSFASAVPAGIGMGLINISGGYAGVMLNGANFAATGTLYQGLPTSGTGSPSIAIGDESGSEAWIDGSGNARFGGGVAAGYRYRTTAGAGSIGDVSGETSIVSLTVDNPTNGNANLLIGVICEYAQSLVGSYPGYIDIVVDGTVIDSVQAGTGSGTTGLAMVDIFTVASGSHTVEVGAHITQGDSSAGLDWGNITLSVAVI
jgi:hypothetical protein